MTGRAIIDALSPHIAVLDASGEIIEVNRAWRSFATANALGMEEFCVGCNYLEVCEEARGAHAEEARQAAEGIRRVLSGKVPEFTLEYPCHSPTEERWYLLVATPVQGDPVGGGVIVHVDITERRRLEVERRQQELLHREAAERLSEETRQLNESQRVAKIGSWYTNLVSFEVVWSDETFKIFGLEPGDFKPSHQAFLEHVHPAERDAVDDAFRQSIGKEGDFAYEHRIVLSSGETKFVVERWRIYYGEDGVALRAVGTCQDVTEARLSEVEFERLFNHSPDVMCVVDLEGRLLQVNPAWMGLLGWRRDELIGKTFGDFVVDEDLPALSSLYERAAAGVPQRDIITRHRSRDGAIRWLSWNAIPLVEFQKIFAVARDMTEQIAVDQHRYRAQRLESIGTLAGGIAHDLNNTLSPIIMGLDMLQSSAIDDESRRLIETISASAQRGAEMVRQVLLFARGERGQRTKVSVQPVIDEIRQFTADRFDKSIKVLSEVENGIWNVEADSTQIHQVLLNLCLNARDAMPRGGRLVLRARNVLVDDNLAARHPGANAGPHVCIEVEDSGVGMTQDVLERAFDPFFTTKSASAGTGLGLSIVNSIVRGHGGFFSARSQPLMWTKISVYIPASGNLAVEAFGSEVTVGTRGSSELILVVDDEPSIREVTRHALETNGYRVLLATDGEDAINIFSAHSADIAASIVDMVMPGMDGIAVIQYLLRVDPRARILAVSGYSTGNRLSEALRIGATSVLMKPFTSSALLSILHQFISVRE